MLDKMGAAEMRVKKSDAKVRELRLQRASATREFWKQKEKPKGMQNELHTACHVCRS